MPSPSRTSAKKNPPRKTPLSSRPRTVDLKEGDAAPAFTAITQTGDTLSLAQWRGRTVVLYFYPRDLTPGCTREACAFRDAHAALKRRKVVVLGVSADSAASHRKFIAKWNLPFDLIADEDHQVAEAYGAWGEKQFMGRRFMGIHRMTCLIGPDGRIRAVWRKVKPETHAEEVLSAIQAAGL